MEQSLSELIQLSRSLGSDIRLVWKGGGNISVKTDNGSMVIKASGTELGRMTRSKGWRKVNVEKVRRLLDDLLKHKAGSENIKKGLLDACCDGLANATMPSIETYFHSLLGCCVIHLHPMLLLPYLCSRNGKKYLRGILPEELDFHWIAFQGLGVVTAGQIREQIGKKKLDLSGTNIFFLSNHGLIVSCQSALQAKKILQKILIACRGNMPSLKRMDLAAKKKALKTAAMIQSCCGRVCGFCGNRKTIPVRRLQTPNGIQPRREWFRGAITPEELTYLGAGIIWLEDVNFDSLEKSILRHFHKTGVWPKAFYVPGQGLFVSDAKESLAVYQKVLAYYLQIRGQAMQLGGLKPLARKLLSGEGL